eukprot:TRINITY_DN394_c3_g1_i1.p2 TRINITY_DN394_c3_g1~~TRINITY_DN394_c3_g1_i1.p2  ORF type:complete len:143 (+),score=47.07 TRINITY_DN394_c3_g1_i1:54-482(+)
MPPMLRVQSLVACILVLLINPARAESGFSQLQCLDNVCSECDTWYFPENTCLQTGSGTWGMGSCTIFGFRQRTWNAAKGGCAEAPDVDLILAFNKCFVGDEGGFFEEVCERSADDTRPSRKTIVGNATFGTLFTTIPRQSGN